MFIEITLCCKVKNETLLALEQGNSIVAKLEF